MITQQPTLQENMGACESSIKQCEDCLRCQFDQFKLEKLCELPNLDDFWKSIFKKLKDYSISLNIQQQFRNNSFDPEKNGELISTPGRVKKNEGESLDARIYKKSKRTFKIVEKVYSILKRFTIFASQNKHIAERLLTAFMNKDSGEVKQKLKKVNVNAPIKVE